MEYERPADQAEHLEVPLRDARTRLGELVEHAQYEDSVVLTKHGKAVAAIVAVDLLYAFERMQEEHMTALLDKRALSETVSLDEVLAETLARPE